MNETRDKLEKVVLNALVNRKDSREVGLTEFTELSFSTIEHKKVFTEIQKLDAHGIEFDSLTIGTNLVESFPLCIEYLERDGVYDYEVIHWMSYFNKLAELIKKDKIKLGLKKITQQIKDDASSEDIAISLVETAELVNKKATDDNNVKYIHDNNADFFDDFMKRRESGEKINGIKTGYNSLDFYLNGLIPGNLITIAGRTTMGKSTLALQIAYNIAKQGIPVLYFHQEANEEEVKNRLIASNKNIDCEALKRTSINDKEVKSMKEFLGDEVPLMLDYTAGISIDHVIKSIRRAKIKRPDLKVVIIDHIQFMQYPEGMTNNNAIDYIIKKYLSCIKKEGLVGIQLSQLNRSSDKEERPPKLSDLRDSGSIEQDSHVVLFIERALKENQKRKMVKNEGRLYIAKNRNGRVGVYVKMFFNEKYVRYDEVIEY